MTAQSSLVETEIAYEQKYVDRVYERVEAMAAAAREMAAEGHARAHLEDGGGVKFDHYRRLFERDAMVNHAQRRLARLNAEHSGLVFGRLDHNTGETNYIGRLGVWDEDYDSLVIDWRAPAAGVFYRATPVEPLGVVRRRVLRSLGERVIGVEDDLLDPDAATPDLPLIGDGALLGAVNQARGQTMRDIVATIQQEQDKAIRGPSSGATLITGGPGTGKTVVALHRAAYLLYSDRRRFESRGVLVIGPSTAFMHYIERVLPSLGEQSVTLRSLGEVVDATDATRRDPAAVAAIKGSLRIGPVLTRVIRDHAPGAPEELRLFFSGRVLRLDARALERIRLRLLGRGTRRNQARGAAVRALLSALWRQYGADRPQRMEREDFDADMRDRREFREFIMDWWPALSQDDVLGWLRSDPERLARHSAGVLTDKESDLLSESWQAHADWSVEDVPLLDELRAMLGVPRMAKPAPESDEAPEEVTSITDREYAIRERVERVADYDEYAHVLVDEAQDLSPMQWRMVGRRGQNASWTVVGDQAQSSWPDADESRAAMNSALGTGARHTYRLTTNYRNSAEIFAFAGAYIQTVAPDADIPNAVRSTGHEPEHRVTEAAGLPAAVGSAVRELLATVEGTIGVIASGHRHAELLAAVGDDERVAVVTPLDCKGMEYDGVVVVEPGEISAESTMGPRILYVALTRATQRLVTVGSLPKEVWLGF
ncbi:MAG TPA: UvrD-helicase domain-containing protein [Mycobacteriales bacterium]|jgi:DNA helicase IV|nr:UvrD-helicase domain-containing protein [Mycobacteriales bacterium]